MDIIIGTMLTAIPNLVVRNARLTEISRRTKNERKVLLFDSNK